MGRENILPSHFFYFSENFFSKTATLPLISVIPCCKLLRNSIMVSFGILSITVWSRESIEKLDANEYMTPGTYMKVKVDYKGLVTGYEEVAKKDLPPVMMSDIEGLEKALRSKADQSSFIALHETIASLSSLPSILLSKIFNLEINS